MRSLAAFVAAAAAAIAQDGITVRDASPNAFGFPLPSLSAAERREFLVGNSFFKQNWVTAPASTEDRDGLGPLFNARSCSACHQRDGRSAPPADGDAARHGLLLRIGVRNGVGPDRPHPAYGAQIQDAAILGVRPEARTVIRTEKVGGEYGDGEAFELMAPAYELAEPAYGPLGDAVFGARTAPALIGLGLLEAIPAARLHALADPGDRDGDGISGRVHLVGDAEPRVPGRFGWKATQSTVRAQTAAAFFHDMGITSSVHPDDGSGGEHPEIDDHTLARVVFYTQALAVPAQRTPDDARVVAGRERFAAFGCAACHVPSLTTGDDAGVAAFRNRTVAPYTDLLLHDMGEGLADGKRDGDAAPAEWRTPPLWGIGLLPVVNGHSRLLHDGRARDLAEAILWHGGEGERARERFRTAPASQRAELLAFLHSL